MDFYSPLYEFFIKQQKLFYKAASEAACGAAVKNEVDTFYAAAGGVPCLWHGKIAAGYFIKKQYYYVLLRP